MVGSSSDLCTCFVAQQFRPWRSFESIFGVNFHLLCPCGLQLPMISSKKQSFRKMQVKNIEDSGAAEDGTPTCATPACPLHFRIHRAFSKVDIILCRIKSSASEGDVEHK